MIELTGRWASIECRSGGREMRFFGTKLYVQTFLILLFSSRNYGSACSKRADQRLCVYLKIDHYLSEPM